MMLRLLPVRVPFIAAFLLVLTFAVRGQERWRDPSPHKTRFVTVDTYVRLEVLDWGGRGRPVVLIPGLGNTAHVYDDFAPKLAHDYHVYGITRRGFGTSSIPSSGYDADRLGDDVLAVLDAVKLTRPVLVGHSLGGEEVSSVATRHPGRVAAAVYLDGGYEYAFHSEAAVHYRDEAARRLQSLPPRVQPDPTDLATFATYRAWSLRTFGYAQPESELRQCCDAADPNASPRQAFRTPGTVISAIDAGAGRYGSVSVPVLAIFVSPHDYDKTWPEKTPEINATLAWERAATEAVIEAFQAGMRSARVVRLSGANHYVFLSNEAEVLREVRRFASDFR